ncbi:MAG: CotH kinase family protein, partial [Candidatus Sumerlaeota bacterium]|nr:CotH kinase family protein [Candidatus Sumerlaeota bacterium]
PMRDDYGRTYDTPWDKLNLGACIQQGDYLNRGEHGLFEAVGFKLFNLAGLESPKTSYCQMRIIDEEQEDGRLNMAHPPMTTSGAQYDGDFWGLYLACEQYDGQFLDEHSLPDGNLYKMEGGTGKLDNQGPTQPSDKSDLNQFVSAYTNTTPTVQWWKDSFDLDRYYSFRSIVEAIHHYDIGYGKNYYYFHNPDNNRWQIHTWDIDLTWANNMYGNGASPFRDRALPNAEFGIAYRNRLREIRDLLYNEDQTWRMIDELAAIIWTPAAGQSFVDADRAMWDYHWVMTDLAFNQGYADRNGKARQGRFYESSVTHDFPGMMQKMKDYVTTRSVWIDTTLLTDVNIPATPTVAYVGKAGNPINDLRFECSPYSHPLGAGTFAAMEWRIGEIRNPSTPGFNPKEPWRYEIAATWESGELAAFTSAVTIPGGAVEIGRTYRVRARMKDNTGRWGHWSAPAEFIVGTPDNNVTLARYLRVTELMYNPPAGSQYEFIELHNTSTDSALLLNGVELTDGVQYVFDLATSIPPAGYLVVCQADPAGAFAAFRAYYGLNGSVPIVGPYSGSFNNAGEAVAIRTAGEASPILSFEYGDGRGWPAAPDGGGHSLVPVASAMAGQDQGSLYYGGNWRASAYINGSPGGPDPEPPADVMLNEFAAHTDYAASSHAASRAVSDTANDSNDWIEIY